MLAQSLAWFFIKQAENKVMGWYWYALFNDEFANKTTGSKQPFHRG